MASHCRECSAPLSLKEQQAGVTLCAHCRFEDEELWRKWRKQLPHCWRCGQTIDRGRYCYWCRKRLGF